MVPSHDASWLKQMNLWMSSKASCGTTGDYIGARSCITGGFGTVTMEKRGRCVADCLTALNDNATKDELHAHNSFIVHLVDVLDLDPAVLNGLWAPDKLPVPGFAVIPLSDSLCAPHMRKPFAFVREQYITIIGLVSTRPAAAFLSGVRDVPDTLATPNRSLRLTVRMGSDCRASPRAMRVAGHALEYEWFLPLDEIDSDWLLRHVNVGESVGPAVNVAIFGVMFGAFELIHEGDNTAECAMLLGTSKVTDLQYIRRRLALTPGFHECKHSLWCEHSFGSGLGFDDANSRELHEVAAGLAAAFGRRRVVVDAMRVPGVPELLADILLNTTPYSKKKKTTHSRRVRFTPTSSDLRPELAEERGEGTCSSAFCTSASHVLSPTPPRAAPLRRAPTAPSGAGLSPTPEAVTRGPRSVSPLPLPLNLTTSPALSPTPPKAAACISGSGPARALRSPQPLNAKVARAIAEAQAGDTLLGTSNPYLLGSGAPSTTRALVVASKQCAHEGIPSGTLSHDSWGFNWAARFCNEHDTPVMRPRIGSPHIDEDAEAELMGLMCFWIASRMAPSPRKLAKGIGNAQPSSVAQAMYGYRRVLRDCGRFRACLHKAGQVLKGLSLALMRTWGQEACEVDHHVPFALEHVRLMHDALRSAPHLDMELSSP